MSNQIYSIDLDSLSIVELKEFINETNILIEKKIEARLQENLEQILNTIREDEIPLAKLLRLIRISNSIYLSKNSDGTERPLYYNRNNPLEMFDGRGRKPKWFTDLEISGADLSKHIVPMSNFSTPYFNE